ncbi:MAG: adenylate/guanylate cyclase domain-containing protein [Burkholderiales bacterium]
MTPGTPCPQCASPTPADARFCPQCGVALTQARAAAAGGAGERRVVAILFADLSGSTRLARELGAEEMHRFLTRYFELVDAIVAQCGGAVDKHMGDGVMALFGAPIAHGNDTLRALRAAVSIHDAMGTLAAEMGRPLTAHVGIASGEVVAADTGSDVHRTYTVTGDAVNLAARLLEVARAGETVISDDVYRECMPSVEADHVATMAIRGFAREMAVWKLRSLRDETKAEHPLIGRDAEVARFDTLLQSVESTRRGASWLVRADPGMGKTRLVQELVSRARSRGFAAFTSTVLDFGAAQGRDAIHAVLASILGVPLEGGAGERRAALDRAVACGGIAGADEPFAADILSIPQRDPGMYEAMDNATRAMGRVRAFAQVVSRAAAGRPTMIVGEDLHWATPVVLAGVRALIDVARDVPLLVVCTSRREGDPFGTPPLDVAVERCDLPPLAAHDAFELARSFLTANPNVAAGCVERAQGNPLFLTQLLRSGADGAAIPSTIQSVVLSRLDRLPPRDKAAMQAAAVVGQRFDLDVLRHLLDDAAYDAGALLGRDLVRADDDMDARRFTFAHALIRDGAYASLLNSRKRALHARAADWYADRDLALHAKHLDLAEDARAAAAYLAAARHEAAAFRFEAAAALAGRGAELPATSEVHFEIARFEGDVALEAGDTAASVAAFERAITYARDDAQRCVALLGIAAAHRVGGATERGFAAVLEAEPLAESAGLVREASRAAYLRGSLEFARGDATASHRAQSEALRRAREAGDREGEARALSGLADVLYAEGRMQSSYDAFAGCVALCADLGFTRFSLNNRCMLAIAHAFLDPADGAIAELAPVRDIARKVRHRGAEVMADECEGMVRAVQGRYDLAVEPLERSLANAREIGSQRFIVFDELFLAYAYWTLGERDRARICMQSVLERMKPIGERFFGGIVEGARALMAEDDEDVRRALADGERSLAQGAPAHCHFWFRREAIDASLRMRDWEGVLAQAAALERFVQREPVPWAELHVRHARTLAAAGQGRPDATELRACRERAQALAVTGMIPSLDHALAGALG